MNPAILDQTLVRQWRRHEHARPIRHRWMETLPLHWKTSRISWLFETLGSGTTPNTSERSYYDGGDIPWVNTGDLNDSLVIQTQKCVNQQALRDHSALKLYPSGTLLVALYGATIGKVGLLSQPSTVNQACFAMGKAKGIVPAYLLYWFIGSREHIVAMSYGGGQPNISGELIRSLRVPVPPLAEQRAIAAFLDRETARIDALIGHKERLIALLEEKRQAVISHAVTRGLDPHVKMKDSGVEWLGMIPNDWDVRRLKHISPEQSVGLVINPSTYVDAAGEVPFLFGANVTPGGFALDAVRRITAESNRQIPKSIVHSGDLVTVRVGAPGVTAVISDELDGCNCASLLIIRGCESFESDWLCFAMNSRVGGANVALAQYGAAQEQFNVSHAVDFVFPVPPKLEQTAIATHLKTLSRSLERTKEKIRESLERLKEHRIALISAAVTGQIDIREEIDLDD
jgi:type I restriction enzyme S subunit